MKLAQALTERSEIQKKVEELSTRLSNNAKVQEGEKPSEDPQALVTELNSALDRLEFLMARINLTNSKTLADGVTVTELIARRDCLKKRLGIMRGFLDRASSRVDRYSKTEIRIVATVDVAELQRQLDQVSKELRQTDEKIQELNWTTELM
ncbi:MAG: DIP1984 family protein [Oscillospiraceae bacterium]|nr:DIP1984 family protein [Oscillospiraceae bacterium]